MEERIRDERWVELRGRRRSDLFFSFKLIEKMLDKETEFQSLVHENDLLRVKQDQLTKFTGGSIGQEGYRRKR